MARLLGPALCINVGTALVADGVADRFFLDGDWSWWIWLGAGALALGVVSALTLWRSFSALSDLKDALPAACAVFFGSWGLAWLGDSQVESEWALAAWGGGLLLAAAGLGWLAVGGDADQGVRVVAQSSRLPGHVLDRADVLLASVGPFDAKKHIPQAIVYTLRRLEPRLEAIVQLDDGSDEAGQTMANYCDLLGMEHLKPKIRRVSMKVDEPEIDMGRIHEDIRAALRGHDPRQVIIDVTGGRVPQSVTLLEIAREMDRAAAVYVAAKEPWVIGAEKFGHTKDTPRAESRKELQKYYKETDLAELSDEVDLAFVRLPAGIDPDLPMLFLNSSVITNAGGYRYRTLGDDEARELFERVDGGPGWQSAIAYEEPAARLSAVLGTGVPYSRERVSVQQQPGQAAIVIKLARRAGAPGEQHGVSDYELGLLVRTS
ncbi:MAG: DUF1874 domain-containing protein [Aeromicrobium sp.]|uniref:STIV orfB116 family protein n=1 Tax=Aeromicrobium sp. TaxID=1871063 RepID=UPI0039E6C481